MKARSWVLLGLIALGASPAAAGLECRGVFVAGAGAPEGSFRCHYRHDALRKVRATCRDGEPGCDTDGACDGACRFTVCAAPGCAESFDVTVPLRRDGRARRTMRFRAGRTRVILACLPARSVCGPVASTTTASTTTTSTTLATRACRGTLGGAASASFACNASLAVGGLGLPVLTVAIDAGGLHGSAAALLTRPAPGVSLLGRGIILMVVTLERPGVPLFQGTHESDGQHAELRLESVVPDPVRGVSTVHGSLDATLPGASAPGSLRLHAEF